MKRTVLFLLCVLATGLYLSPARAAVDGLKFIKMELGQPGWILAVPMGINDQGDVVGAFADAGPMKGFLYSGGTYTEILPSGWTSAIARTISENGRIVGDGSVGGTTTGFHYSGGVYTPMLPPGWIDSEATDVNNSGQVVGTGWNGFNTMGFLYDGGTYSPIFPAGYTDIENVFINKSGTIAGNGWVGGSKESFLINGSLTPVGPAGWSDVEVVGINDRGDVAGNGSDGMTSKCFVLSGGVYEVVSHPDWFGSQCFAVNNSGDVFGWGISGPISAEYFIYRDGSIYTFDPGYGYFIPSGFNSRFEVIGYALEMPATYHGLVLSMLPSPDVMAGSKDGPLGAGPAGSPSLNLSMLAWTFAGRQVESWLVVQTPAGILSYDPFAKTWSPGLTPAAQMPLRNIPTIPFSAAPAAGPGIYTYYFGIDAFPNDRIDPAAWFSDILSIIRR